MIDKATLINICVSLKQDVFSIRPLIPSIKVIGEYVTDLLPYDGIHLSQCPPCSKFDVISLIERIFKTNLSDLIKIEAASNPVRVHRSDRYWTLMLTGRRCTLQDIPPGEQTPSVCKLAVKINPRDFYYIPEHEKTPSLCSLAMKSEPAMLFFLPQKYQTKELFLQAIRKNGLLITSVPTQFRDQSIYSAAVEQNGLSLEFVPEEMMTRSLALRAVRENPEALRFVPHKLRSKRLCQEALRLDSTGASIRYIPIDHLSDSFIRGALRIKPNCLGYLDPSLQNQGLWKTAITSDPMAIRHVPFRHQTRELCSLALGKSLDCWPFINKQYLYGVLSSCPLALAHQDYPGSIPVAVSRLSKDEEDLSEALAKAYLVKVTLEELSKYLSPTPEQILKLADFHDSKSLAEFYHDEIDVLTALFRKTLDI